MQPKEYLLSNEGRAFSPDGIATIYYPGGFLDYSPLDLLLGRTSSAVVAIYADYFTAFDDEFANFLKSIRRRYYADYPIETELTPKDFNAKHIKDFYPNDWTDELRRSNRGESQYQLGFRYYYPKINFTLIYLKADAVKVYTSLQKVNIYPDVVVLQDHGGIWTEFGGDSSLYKAAKRKPKYLYVARNTTVWPGYTKISDASLDEGQTPHFLRSLYIKS